jgi:neutral ceramidase
VNDNPLLPYLDADPGWMQLDLDGSAAPSLPHAPELLAGAAEVDITPPPGMPKAGHSKNAQDGIGFRTRLRARIIHLRGATASVALVAGDIHSGSAVIHRLLARAVADETDVGLAGLLLGATHTHAGPGQFHGCDFYNRFASNRPGFDPRYAHFLVERLAAGVKEAVSTRRPARVATGSSEVWGYTRNRSLTAHVLNSSVDDKRTGAQRKYAAVNPWLHLLRVDAAAPAGGFEPLAALAVFSIHGTGISRRDPAYNADVWAYITGSLAAAIERQTGCRPVVGAIEGTHGDVTPAVRTGMLVYPEAERVGRGIGEAAGELYARLEGSLRADVALKTGLVEVDLADRPLVDGIRLPDPAIGAAKLAGAIENTTPVLDRIPPFRAGYPKPRAFAGGDQGAKWVAASRRLQRRIAPLAGFPRVLPIQLIGVGSMGVLGLPFEVTVEAGRRLEASTLPALERAGIERVVVSSTANDYWDYLTTPEEYSLQCYEGASTLYGPQSHAFVTAMARRLAVDVAQEGVVAGYLPSRTFCLHTARYMPVPTGSAGGSRTQHSRVVATGPTFADSTPGEDAYWEFQWWDVPPGDLQWNEPMVRVEKAGAGAVASGWVAATDADGQPIDDQGWRVGVVHLGAGRGNGSGAHRYAARWYGPPLGTAPPHRFVLMANAGQPELTSEAFD